MREKVVRNMKALGFAVLMTVFGTATVLADEIPGDTVTVPEITEQQTTELQSETVTTEKEIQETTTQDITKQQPTTQQPTTQKPTEAPTTKVSSTKTAPWSKNKDGKFVNGNGVVIPGATMKGIDVSKWNGKIDWSKVAQTDVDYAIIRCGYGDNLVSQDDQYWKANVEGCEKYNIPFGVYIYSYATTTTQAKSEAEHVLRLIKGHTLNFPIYYDMEEATQAKLGKTKLNSIATTFLNAIKAEGYECGIYANLNWWNNYLPDSLATNTPWKWVAQYNNNACTYNGVYQMWQSTSDGSVDGINGRVDLNFWFGAVRTRLYNIQSIKKVETPKPVTAPKKVTLKSVTAKKKKAVVKWVKRPNAKGYQIQYSTNKNFKAKYTKSKTTKKTSVTIKKLTSKKTYYFRVRAYKTDSAKKKVYSKKWSKVKKVKIK